ncbi:MAG: response regulator transcription factor [Sedimentisphaerales bacterium]|nr:response regulator transcription factor [Sedimentisphaerales bacterium]
MARGRCVTILSEQEWGMLTDNLRLSSRQAEIARLVLRGMADKQIAWQLGISFGTLRTHMSRLFQKCDVNDRLELLVRIYATLEESRQNRTLPLAQHANHAHSKDRLRVTA